MNEPPKLSPIAASLREALMEVGENPPVPQPDIEWVASWGDKVKVGDLVKVAKAGGPVRVRSMRRFNHNHAGPRPVLVDEEDDGHWYYGCVITDAKGQDFHLFIQPHEPCFIAVEVPKDLSTFDVGEAPSTDGA